MGWEERWREINTPKRRAETIEWLTKLSVSLFSGPEEAAEVLESLSDEELSSLTYGGSGVGDSETAREFIEKLRE